MSSDLGRFHQVFFDEAKEHLDEMERLLLALNIAMPEAEDLDAIFRAAHSIKGGSGTFGFGDMAEVTHVLETGLDRVRKRELALSDAMVDILLQACDVLQGLLATHRDGLDSEPEAVAPFLLGLRDFFDSTSLATDDKPALPEEKPSESQPSCWYRIHYVAGPQPAIPLEALLEELGRLGDVIMENSDGESCLITLSCQSGLAAIEDVFSFVAQPEQYTIEPVSGQHQTQQAVADDDGFGFFTPLPKCDAVAEQDDGFGFFVDPESLPFGSASGDAGYGFFTDNLPIAPAANTSSGGGEFPRRRASDREAETSIRVSVDKVDQLINLVGELVITHAMLAQTISTLDPVLHEKLFTGMGQLERNSRDLQESVMSIRMLPIGSVFSRFPRLVRDLSGKLGKQVELKLVGESTELDKGVIERLADPLTHLVRNSLDHGIEMPDLRVSSGKSARGMLTLQAAHQGGNIVIEVIDDGAGLYREKILAKARERGLAVSDDATDSEIWQLIFAPGFSTAAQVTDVSGRGVGMDVVKSNIESMGGRVEISSQQGFGTRISIRLPLTLAILDGMSVGVGEQVFILPLNMIVESLQPRPEQISIISGSGRVVHVRGEYLPLIALHQVFNIVPLASEPSQGIVVILDVEGGKVALFVDALLGQHQVVIKSLEKNYRKVRGVSGATIMGDGRVALILDAAALVQLSRS